MSQNVTPFTAAAAVPADHSDAVVVLCTAPDEACAQELAAALLGEKLAACVTLIPGATSLYYWEGKLEQEYEVQMIIKSERRHQQALLAYLKHQHPYQTPELLVIPVQAGDQDYLSWLNASLR
ncbi:MULTISPECIES: divalent cation tolerance protein CutA [Edwardsiella]|uniref:Divalent-cation tolerance protein CutA n=2 Tax=Edwardsiella anguillarum TaxID=1821960 RepID=A0A076LJ05_9GAMM|nr:MULTISPECIES: divalent cation tolerance protein CutA [Edwardsiella]AKM46148.1 cation tolerance protein CutA [Edwardsiella sp. EA181011]GAJ67171.1 periplasmic divalent cation tolerance protein CutA [Edwardsiella piscicida]AIJ08520.1 divalent cation tolerance protein, CutA1 family [Edwardsiella anguillarum ET080813]AKR76583.1 divalent cation tolerance protein CutA [Edwardsiella sp. LADL05-105]KAB0593024.1 divalent cation tolerance protein CutA [Edwardsiella anguillarum]